MGKKKKKVIKEGINTLCHLFIVEQGDAHLSATHKKAKGPLYKERNLAIRISHGGRC